MWPSHVATDNAYSWKLFFEQKIIRVKSFSLNFSRKRNFKAFFKRHLDIAHRTQTWIVEEIWERGKNEVEIIKNEFLMKINPHWIFSPYKRIKKNLSLRMTGVDEGAVKMEIQTIINLLSTTLH